MDKFVKNEFEIVDVKLFIIFFVLFIAILLSSFVIDNRLDNLEDASQTINFSECSLVSSVTAEHTSKMGGIITETSVETLNSFDCGGVIVNIRELK